MLSLTKSTVIQPAPIYNEAVAKVSFLRQHFCTTIIFGAVLLCYSRSKRNHYRFPQVVQFGPNLRNLKILLHLFIFYLSKAYYPPISAKLYTNK